MQSLFYILKYWAFRGAKVRSEPLEDGVDEQAVVREELHTAITEFVEVVIQLLL